MIHGSETTPPMKKPLEIKLAAACRNTNSEVENRKTEREGVQNDAIWEIASAIEASKETREKRLHCCRHVTRRDESHVERRTLDRMNKTGGDGDTVSART